MNAEKNLSSYFTGEPPGERTNAVRWLQKKVMERSLSLPRDFPTRESWEKFRASMVQDLPRVIGVPEFPAMRESFVRGRIRVGQNALCERVDVFVDADYSIPTFVFCPVAPSTQNFRRSSGIRAGRRINGMPPTRPLRCAWQQRILSCSFRTMRHLAKLRPLRTKATGV